MPSNEDLFCGVIYIPPNGSKYAHSDPYLELQTEFNKVCLDRKNVLLLGDFNSRTASLCDFIKCDDFICDIYGSSDLYDENMCIFRCFEIHNVPLQRNNLDSNANAYGHQLAEFCKNNNVFILNGRLDSDTPRLTCKNASTVDYILSSAFNFEMLSSFSILDFDLLLSDAHCPLSLVINLCPRTVTNRAKSVKHAEPELKLWDDSKKETFVANINYGDLLKINSELDLLMDGYNVTAQSIESVVGKIENLFKNSSLLSFGFKGKRKQNNRQKCKNKQWFNFECHTARNLYHNTRKLYNKYKTTRYKNLLGNVSKEYKNTISRNVKRYKNEKIKKLKTLKNAKPRDFWKIINSINEKAKDTASLDDLFTYFKNINANHTFDENEDIQSGRTDITNTEATANMNLEINQPFTEYEIIKTVKNLKNNKSPGIDNIINEHMKTTINVMAPIYVKLFNLIFDSGFVPDNWTLGNILPIYKNKGNINLAENYRPITLLSCLGKVFTAILNDRIAKYLDENNIIDSCQAGFRKGFSTIDNLFILQSLIDIAKVNKTKLYCAFIDFKQAFDKVWRSGLWRKLLNNNVNGKCFRFITNMYSNIKSRIKTAEGASAFFPCQTGVRQGENLSPLLFSIYLNDLKSYLDDHNAPGVKCELNDENISVFFKLFILLFADDTVLFGNSSDELQNTLSIFENYCNEWKLTVNVSKTKIVIFSGGRIPQDQKFQFGGEEVEIVSDYKYLGVILSRSGSFLKAKKYIADQANTALFSLLRKIRTLNLPIDMQIDLFNKIIKPILLYGSEIWGFGNLDVIEKVQLKFFKQILNLKKSTPSTMVYGELGAYPLSIDIYTRVVAFWIKLNVKGINATALSVYNVIYGLNNQGKLNSKWLDNVKNLICTNGYSNIWYEHNVTNISWFVKSFKQKLKDEYIQNWSSLVDKASSGINYRMFKETFQINNYFSYLTNKKIRIMTAFRTRNHRLPIEIGRWQSIPLNERICWLCNDDIGDEFHYVLKCRYFNEERQRLIKPYFFRNPNTIKFNSLMNSSNRKVINNLCSFIEIIMKIFRQHTQ